MSGDDRAWQLDHRETRYEGFYQIDRVRFRHTLFRGGWTEDVHRELFVRGNVTAVLPYDPRLDQVVLIEQFRIGAMHQTPSPWLMEVIAGMIEPGEEPPDVARREAEEEAGLILGDTRLIAHYLASPGASTEEVFIFFAEVDLSDAGGVYGLAEEDEDILVHVLPAERAIEMLDARVVKNAISVVALQWLKGYRAGV